MRNHHWVVEQHLVTGILNSVNMDVLEIFSQSFSPVRLHPILISIQKVNLYLRLHLLNDHLDTLLRLQRPVKQSIKSLFTAFFLLANLFQVLLPNILLIFRQFQPVLQDSINKFAPDETSIHQSRRTNVHIVDYLSHTKEKFSVLGSLLYVFVSQPSSPSRRDQNQLFDSLRVFLKVMNAQKTSKAMPSKNKAVNANLLSPLLKSFNVIADHLLSSHIIVPVSSGRQSNSKSIQSVYLKVIYQMLEHSDISQRSSPIPMQQNQMRQRSISNCVHLVQMLCFINRHVSVFEIDMYVQIGELQGFSIDLDKLFGHDGMVTNCYNFSLHEFVIDSFFLHNNLVNLSQISYKCHEQTLISDDLFEIVSIQRLSIKISSKTYCMKLRRNTKLIALRKLQNK